MSIVNRVQSVLLALSFVAASLPAPPAFAQAAKPDVGVILFEADHFKSTDKNAKISYTYSRTSKDAERTKPSFKDVIELTLEPAEAPAARNVSVTLFKGPMHRAAGPFDGITFNPVVLLVLEYHLTDFAKILGGNARYFKNAIRAGMRDQARIEPVRITVGGKEVDARKITVKPFENDPQKPRFREFAEATYQFTVSDAVPGTIYEIRIWTPDPAGGEPVLEELTRYVDN